MSTLVKKAGISQEEEKLISQAVYEGLSSRDPDMQKEAADAIDDYTRLRVREEAYVDQVLPPITITSDDLDRQYDDEKNVKIVDMEPDSCGALAVPLGSTPMTYTIRARRYKVQMSRRQTQRYQKDVSALRTWIMDIRQVFADNSIKDIHYSRDRAWQRAVDALNPVAGQVNAMTGVAMYKKLPGGINRNSGWDMTKVTRDTQYAIAPKVAVTNHVTIIDFLKFDRVEFGGDIAERVMKNGVAEIEGLYGLNWVVTIKKALLPNNHVYLYPDTQFLGKHFVLEQPTMHIKREAYMVEFFTYEESGATIGHTGSSGHVEFVA